MQENQKIKIMPAMRKMAVGDSLVVPIERGSYASAICSRLSLEWNKKFSSSRNREARTITIKRLS